MVTQIHDALPCHESCHFACVGLWHDSWHGNESFLEVDVEGLLG